MKKEFLKQIKAILIADGWQIDKYISTSSEVSFFKRNTNYYYYISCFPERGLPYYYFKVGCSSFIITPTYDYGYRNSLYLNDDLVEWCSRFNVEGTSDGYNIDIGVTEESRDRATGLFHLFYKTLFEKNYFKNAESQLMSNPHIQRKYEFLQKVTEEFFVEYESVYKHLNEPEYINMVYETFSPNVTDAMKKIVTNVKYSFGDIWSFTTAEILFRKRFEKVMKSTPDLRNKFLFYLNFIFMIPTGDEELDVTLRINPLPLHVESQSALQYSAFMTFVEKPY